MKFSIYILVAGYFLCTDCLFGQNDSAHIKDGETITGMTLVAPPRPFEKDPMPGLMDVNVQWVAVVPYAFTPKSTPYVKFDSGQWWGETPEGSRQTIRMAKAKGMKVMLKPQVWMQGDWVGDMTFESENEWNIWERDYRAYILAFAEIAAEEEVDLFCIGTEYKLAIREREAFWRTLVDEIRAVYTGDLTYSSNWDEYREVPIWDIMDYIGISAYFPLTDRTNPDEETLLRAWVPISADIESLSCEIGKAVIFTEFGYLSVDGAAGKTWLLEKKRWETPTNEALQARAIEALFKSFSGKDFWAGGFYWKWYGTDGGKSREKDYTPEGKLALETIRTWYAQMRP